MRLVKKITSLLLATIIMMSLTVVMAAEPSVTVNKETPESYLKRIKMLSALDIYSFQDRDYNETVTRGEFARIVTDLLGIDSGSFNGSGFDDVNVSVDYADSIKTVVDYGVMNGMGDGKFYPSKNITYMQALKTLLCALGYKDVAEVMGGYPMGYRKHAMDIGLTVGSPKDWDAPLTFELASQLVLLAAEADVVEVVGATENSAQYRREENKKLLNVYHNIYLKQGQIVDNGVTAVNGKSTIDEDCIKIDNLVLEGANKETQKLIGQIVEYYYKDNDGVYTLLYAYGSPNKNNIVTIPAKDILKDDGQFSKNCFVANVEGKKRRFKIDGYANLLYNGSLDETFTENTLKITEGYVTLLDADSDGIYELVMVEEYVDIVVSLLNTEIKTVSAKSGPTAYNKVSYADYRSVVFEDENGNEINPADIMKDNVLSVFKSKDNGKIRFVLSNKSMELRVDSIYEEDGRMTVDSGEKTYDISDCYFKMMNERSVIYPKPVFGTYYKAYLNYENNICMLEEVSGRKQYAYLFDIIQGGTGLKKNQIYLKLHLESDLTIYATVSDKLSINQVKGKSGQDLLNNETLVDGSGNTIPQLVMITLTSKGEVTAIEIDNTADSGTFGFDLEHFSLDYATGTSSWDPYDGLDGQSIGGYHCITSNTKIFCIPESSSELTETNEEKVRVMSYKDFIANFGRAWFKLYDANATWEAAAAVVGDIPNSVGSSIMTVISSKKFIDEEGYDKTQVTGWVSGRIITYNEMDEGIIERAVKLRHPDSDGNLKTGDMINIGLALDGELSALKLLYSPLRDNNPDYCFTEGSLQIGEPADILGYLCAADGGRIATFSKANSTYVNTRGSLAPTSDTFWASLMTSSASIMHFDCIEKTINKITYASLPVTSAYVTENGYSDFDTDVKVFVRRNHGMATHVYLVTGLSSNY